MLMKEENPTLLGNATETATSGTLVSFFMKIDRLVCSGQNEDERLWYLFVDQLVMEDFEVQTFSIFCMGHFYESDRILHPTLTSNIVFSNLGVTF